MKATRKRPEAIVAWISEAKEPRVLGVYDDLRATTGMVEHDTVSEFERKVGPRVPITKNALLFEKCSQIGLVLIKLHTYGECFGEKKHLPKGSALCTKAISTKDEHYPETFSYDKISKCIVVGDGRFEPVENAVWEFKVSGLQIVPSWLAYRMKIRKGRRSSPLDEIHPDKWRATFTTELLQLLAVIETTLSYYPKQAELLESVLSGHVFVEKDFDPVPDWYRNGPQSEGLFKTS